MKSKQAVDPLIQLLGDDNSGWMAGIALGKIGSEQAVKQLLKLLRANDIQKRRAAAWALEKLWSKKAVKVLRKALNDEDEEVRMWAKFAIEKINCQL